MAGTNDLASMVPGFEFLQGLFKNAGAGLPHIGQWVAPTLDPEELEKRIQELKTVQFWLEQNARLLGTTIQALEVQRMTLSTLQTMNLPLGDLGEALMIRMPAEATPAAEAPAPQPAPVPPPAPVRKAKPRNTGPAVPLAAAAAVDPMKWWGALTQQFTELATKAVQDAMPEAAPAPKADSAPAAKAPGRKRAARPR
jgi:hypothetical protein